MSFANPVALLLLLAIPYFMWLGWPRVAYRHRRDTVSLTLRVIIAVLLIMALSGLQAVQAANKLSVVFLIDASDSIDATAQAQADQYVREAMSQMGPEDRAGIVVFGKNALVDRAVQPLKDPGSISSVPVRLDTNIAGAIRLALAMLPSDTARRIVLLSDGVETLGNATEAARLAAATNVQIDVIPLRRKSGPEVLISDVRLPTTVNQGEIFDLGITVESQVATVADLTVLASGSVVQTRRVDLKVGTNNFVMSLTAPRQGFSDFEVHVDVPGTNDTFYQNNELAGFSEVTGPPRVLLISSTPEEVAALLPALQQQGIQVDIQKPNDLPIGLAPLATYKSVVLANVSAIDLSEQRMKVLQTYVRDLGGGLVVIGGPNAFGTGGYFQTPLEEALPVESRIKDQKRIPKLLMVYVIDRSGSMEEQQPGNAQTNLELAKEAARRSIEFLFPQDRAGVLSFDSNPQWLVEIQQVNEKSGIQRLIGQLRPGGGTDILAAVRELQRTVPNDPSTLKHIILLTDGGADPTNIVQTISDMHDRYGITVTSIGIGNGVPSFMRDIAIAGRGIYYNVTNVSTLPQVFTSDTVLATRSYILEQEFTATQSANSPIMQGIDALPSLLGYIATTPKDTATVILRAPGFDDPLLASWQYGLGRAVAWTSDASTRWARNWTTWEDYGRFWSQVIRYTITDTSTSTIDSHVEQRNGQAVLVVHAHDASGVFVNGLSMDAAVIDPKLQSQTVKLKQVAPGHYEANIDPQTEGAYFIRIGGTGTDPNGQSVSAAQTTGWVLSYSPEYRLRETNINLLSDVMQLTGGNFIDGKPELAFSRNVRATQAATPVAPLLLLIVTILLPLDIAVRRVIVTRSDMQKLSTWTRDRFGLYQRGDTTPATSGKLDQLKAAKDRAASGAAIPSPINIESIRELARSHRETEPVNVEDTPQESKPVVAAEPITSSLQNKPTERKAAPTQLGEPLPAVSPKSTEDAPSSGTLASRLLDRRKNRDG